MDVNLIDHPLIKHKLGLLRRLHMSPRDFKDIVEEVSTFLCYEALRALPLTSYDIAHWQGKLTVEKIKAPLPTFCPILRAGLGMLAGALKVIPNAPVSMIGMRRDEETAKAHCYYFNPCTDIDKRIAILLDPMLATAGSMISAIKHLQSHNCKAFMVITLLCAPEGIKALRSACGEAVTIYTAAIDQYLNKDNYIVPGLADAGDKLFGTL